MEEELIKKIQPHSEEAEKSVLGAMIMERDAIGVASDMLVKEDFYQAQNGILFEAMTILYHEGRAVDPVTLKDKLGEMNAPESLCQLDHLRDLVEMVPTSANIKQYVQIVQEKATLRQVIKVSEKITNQAYLNKEEASVLIETMEKQVFDLIQKRRGIQDFTPIMDVTLNALKTIEEASKTQGVVTGIPTGFTDLDMKLTGMHGSQLILVAARPAMGKTAFVLNIAEHVVFKKNIPTAIFSLEMGKEDLVMRLMAMHSLVDSQKIRTGNLNDSEWDKVMESTNIIGNSKLVIDDTGGIGIGELRSKCRKYKQNFDLGLIIIDYLQLMSGSGKGNESRQQEISEISRSLKALARELNVPIIALSQLSRAVESRDDHRPRMSDLRESGAIEQDADVIMFIYRDEYYKKLSAGTGEQPASEQTPAPSNGEDYGSGEEAEIIVAKQRNGATGTVRLTWLGKFTKFTNMGH